MDNKNNIAELRKIIEHAQNLIARMEIEDDNVTTDDWIDIANCISEGLYARASHWEPKDDKDAVASLIADMILKGATMAEIEHVVDYSRDIIDAEKKCIHSYELNDIATLEEKYQG